MGVTCRGVSRATALISVAIVIGACQGRGGGDGTQDADAPAVVPTASASEAAATITEEDMAFRVGVIAHDSMRGRNTPSPGLDATASWIAEELRGFGLRGGAHDGGFLQRYPLRAVVVDSARSSIVVGTDTLSYGVDVAPFRGGSGPVDETAEVVVVTGASGTVGSLEHGVRDRHVVMVGDPDGSTRAALQLAVYVANAGAASVWIPSPAPDDVWAEGVARAFQPEISKGWGPPPPTGRAATPILTVREPALARVLAELGLDLGGLRERATERARSTLAPGGRASLRHVVRVDEITAPNVVGVLEGSDVDLSDQYVVFSAHMDHLGTGPPNAEGDSIYNGADDDASGTAAVMEIAQAMATMATPPRRSTVFLLVSGEEHGLWGSEWYVDHPTGPIERYVADLNLDMIGRNWPDTIVAIGREHSDLGETLDRVDAAHPELGMTAIDDVWPEERFYYRSDHFNFARRGVPILFFFNGTHADYHEPDDEPESLNAEKAARVARLVFYLGLEVADATEPPIWNPESYEEIVGR